MSIKTPHVHTEQEILNSSFDNELGVSMTELIGADGNLMDLAGFNIPSYDEIDLTYVAAGNGEGEIETAIYSKDSTPHTTLTLTYNGDDEISNVTKT